MCQADPAEVLSAVFASLDAMVEIRGPRGTRVVSVNGFHTGPYSTVVEPDEILTEVSFVTQKNLGSAYEKVERRVGDWAIAAAGAVIALQDGKIQRAGIGLAAVGAPDFRASRAEAYLLGKDATSDLFDEAARMASAECNPHSDQRGPSAYKRHLVEVLTRRALDGALSNSKGKAN
jgi:carbon-monoxide dehydrogenase medium subunit